MTTEEIQAAEKVIASLEPHPGRAFQPSEPTVYVRPDIFVAELDGEWKVILNEYYLPRVSISDYYTRLLKESDEQETREYLQKKMQQAKWLLGSLERRGSTLRACAEAILDAQLPFFTGQTGELSPMSLSTLAESLGVHPSTVSRATGANTSSAARAPIPCGTSSAGPSAPRAFPSRRSSVSFWSWCRARTTPIP